MFIYNGINKKIKEATRMANANIEDILHALSFREENFKEANINGKELADLMREYWTVRDFHVKTYWYWSKRVMGKFEPAEPDSCWINTRTLGFRTAVSIYCTVIHEFVHYIDNIESSVYCHHAGNTYRPWKEDCAPFYADSIAEKLLNPSSETEIDRDHTTKIKTYNPWWKRILFFWRY